jgi:hypothetical protein
MPIKDHPLSKFIPETLWPTIDRRDGASQLVKILKEMYPPEKIAHAGYEQQAWEYIGLYYRDVGLLYQAIIVINALYEHMLAYQQQTKSRIHKGMPLVWLRDFHIKLGHPVTAKRYALLTLCEDSIGDKGKVNIEGGGIYFRLSFEHGMPDSEIFHNAERMYKFYEANPTDGAFPEWIIQDLDNNWMIEYPSNKEPYLYVPNRIYMRHLATKIPDPTGEILERLSEYVLSTIPGFRTYRRQRTPSTDYDIVCAVEGLNFDFRAELGRYIICECKDWTRPVDFSAVVKFCRVLDSAKCKSGIIFSRSGISGESKTKFAEREILKIFQDRGMVIMVIDSNDMDRIYVDGNVISMLRKKYEQVRLDLAKI